MNFPLLDARKGRIAFATRETQLSFKTLPNAVFRIFDTTVSDGIEVVDKPPKRALRLKHGESGGWLTAPFDSLDGRRVWSSCETVDAALSPLAGNGGKIVYFYATNWNTGELTSVRSMGLVPQGCPKIGVQFLSVLASPGVADEVRAT